MNRPRIFVQLASYKDPECLPTIESLLSKAAFPSRIVIGVCWQYDAEGGSPDIRVGYAWKRYLRVDAVPVTEGMGMGWARARAQALCGDEEYTLQIDSHMRFEQYWDEKLIRMLNACPSERPLLSGFVPGYDERGQGKKNPSDVTRLAVMRLGTEQEPPVMHLGGAYISRKDAAGRALYPSPCIIGNFIFAPSAMFRDVPIDPQIFFYGDGVISAKLWTHGYDIFQLGEEVLYHKWVDRELFGTQDYKKLKHPRAVQTRQRIRHLLGLEEASDAAAIAGLEQFGLGSARPLSEFWEACGIDPVNRTLADHATKGRWPLLEQRHAKAGNVA